MAKFLLFLLYAVGFQTGFLFSHLVRRFEAGTLGDPIALFPISIFAITAASSAVLLLTIRGRTNGSY
jgi:multisubunit Na+/H+ antiporter MnhE subunit